MDINQLFEQIFALYNSKGDPNKMMQMMYQQNPNISQYGPQFNSMIANKSRPDAYMEIAKKIGLNEQNLQTLGQILGVKQ